MLVNSVEKMLEQKKGLYTKSWVDEYSVLKNRLRKSINISK